MPPRRRPSRKTPEGQLLLRCSCCGQFKPAAAFRIHRQRRDGRQSQCRHCQNREKVRWQRRDLERHALKCRIWRARQRKRREATEHRPPTELERELVDRLLAMEPGEEVKLTELAPTQYARSLLGMILEWDHRWRYVHGQRSAGGFTTVIRTDGAEDFLDPELLD